MRRKVVWWYIIGPKAKRCRAVLTVSNWAADRIADWLNLDRSSIRVIGNGLEEAYHPRTQEEVKTAADKFNLTGPYFVLMGNPMPHKNLWLGAAAFQELCRKGFKGSLVIVGSRDMELPQGPGRVVRAEAIGDDLLAALHSGTLGTLFPSLAEGFGLPPLEAMACGAPVVASDLPVFREVLGQEAAYLFPLNGGDTTPLVEQLAYLAERPPEVEERTKANLALARRHTWARAAGRLREVFDLIEAGREL
jgi:glycosyltransferase involved in cell wall biosynthesis